jgi:hypothetical protein
MLMMRPATGSLHAGGYRLRAEKRTRDVDVEDPLPVGLRYFLERPADLTQHTAGVVDQNVDLAGSACRFRDDRVHGAFVRDVRDARLARASSGSEPFGLAELIIDDIARPYARATVGERQARSRARSRAPRP